MKGGEFRPFKLGKMEMADIIPQHTWTLQPFEIISQQMWPDLTMWPAVAICDLQLNTLWHYLLQYVISSCKIYLKVGSWIVARCDQMLPGVTRYCQMWPDVARRDHFLYNVTSTCHIWDQSLSVWQICILGKSINYLMKVVTSRC